MSVNEDSRRPPEDAIDSAVERVSDGTISVGEDPLEKLVNETDWNNLSPFQEYVLVILDENNLLPDE